MEDKLKLFVHAHREEFNNIEPPTHLWSTIEAGIKIKNAHWLKSNLALKLLYFSFSASLIAILIYYVSTKTNQENIDLSGDKNIVTTVVVDTSKLRNDEENNKNKNEKQDTPFIASNQIIKEHELIRVKVDSSKTKVNINNSPFIQSEDKIVNTIDTNGSTNLITNSGIDSIPLNMGSMPVTSKRNNFDKTIRPNCRLWETPDYCNVPDSLKLPVSINFKGTIIDLNCNKVGLNTNVKAVWLTLNVDKRTIFSLENDFKNIRLIKKNGEEMVPVAMSGFITKSGYMSSYKGNEFFVHFDNRLDLIIFFPGAEIGDIIHIDNFVEAEIRK
ncbi:MAG: hypothetical protein IPM74_12490 [Crocinitomicaceae bacterium]|nr:hypothetical protein [Crocinitomicaceae bacterium]MBK8926694.1 hypothetical protein [Crocinitomicaceae bacterium]